LIEIPMEQTFETRLTARGPKGAWVFLPIPFNVEEVFGTKTRVPVTGTVNGSPFRNHLLPEGDGTHAMAFGKDLQIATGAKAGDLVSVKLTLDEAERTVDVPAELQEALAADPAAGAIFEALAYSHKKEYAQWIAEAKKPETRSTRIAKALEMLKAGKKRLR